MEDTQVTHEVEESITVQGAGGPLVGAGSVYVTCDKNRANPGHHDKFIKVNDFTVDKIPDIHVGCSLSKDLLHRWIKSHVPLVGRIHSKYISKERPDTWHNGRDGYLFAGYKGRFLNIVASGCVLEVNQKTDGECKCMKCSVQQLKPASPYWVIGMRTARHVLYDTSEVQHSDFILFDDNDDGSGTVTLSGGEVWRSDTESDSCDMRHYTHDQALAIRLSEMLTIRDVIRNQINQLITARDLDTLPVFVVAHPHGRQKYVTVGEFKGPDGRYHNAVTFTSPTCPGCSGGAVICVGYGRPHSGADAEGKGVSADYCAFLKVEVTL